MLIPCYNEEQTIGKVVDDFRRVLPGAAVWVGDNNSSGRTAEVARAHGARVRREPRQGKGNAVRQMLRGIDHVVGDRLSNGTYGEENKRQFHGFGNGLVRWLIRALYGFDYADVMTGYRAMSRPFCRTYPVLSPDFEL